MNSDPGIEADNEHAGPVRSKLSSRMGGRRRRPRGTRTDRISRWKAAEGPKADIISDTRSGGGPERTPLRVVQEEQHERGPAQCPVNLVRDEPLRPPVDPDPSWEWRRGSRSSRTGRCDERYVVVVFEPVTASQSFSRTASSLSASSWLREATATSPRVFSIRLRATSCLRFRATKAVG